MASTNYQPNQAAPRPAERPPAAKKFNPLLPIGVVGALLIGGFLLSRRGSGGAAGGEKPKGPDIPVVQAVAVRVGDLSQTLRVTGTLRSDQNIDLSSKLVGRVARVTVREGARVQRGQLLVQLEDDELRAQVDQAQAALRASEARLEQSVVGLPSRVSQVNTGIQSAQSQVQTARARYQQAVLNEPVRFQSAQSQLRTAEETARLGRARLNQARETARLTESSTSAEVRRATAALNSARANLAEVRRGARDQQVAQAQQQVSVLQAQLDLAEAELRRARTLVQGGAAPQSSVDQAQAQYEVTKAQLESARQNLSLVQEGATTEQVRQAQEGVRQAEAQLSQAQANRGQVVNAQSEVTAALATLGQAQSNVENARANLAQIPITRQETRAAREAVLNAESGLTQARSNRTQIPTARADISAARAAVSQSRAQLQQAQISLNNARIYSPVNGVVNTKLTDVGEAVSPGASLLNLVALDSVYFEAFVSEKDLARVRRGQPAQVTLPSASAKAVGGRVTQVIPVADQRLRQFRVRIALNNRGGALTPGAFARGVLTTNVSSNTLLVPAAAIRNNNGKTEVLIASGKGEGKDKTHTVQRRTVRVGAQAGETVELLSGVQQGDQVILASIGELQSGEKVKIASS